MVLNQTLPAFPVSICPLERHPGRGKAAKGAHTRLSSPEEAFGCDKFTELGGDIHHLPRSGALGLVTELERGKGEIKWSVSPHNPGEPTDLLHVDEPEYPNSPWLLPRPGQEEDVGSKLEVEGMCRGREGVVKGSGQRSGEPVFPLHTAPQGNEEGSMPRCAKKKQAVKMGKCVKQTQD